MTCYLRLNFITRAHQGCSFILQGVGQDPDGPVGQATGVKADDLNLAVAAELPNPPVENSTSEVGLGGLVVSEHDGGAALGQPLRELPVDGLHA